MSQTTAWLILIAAGFCEIGFTTSMKLSQNFSDIKWVVAFALFMTCSIYLLNKSIQIIPLGTAYAVWTGIGALGTVLVGIYLFKEPITIMRMTFLLLIIVSLVGLKLVS